VDHEPAPEFAVMLVDELRYRLNVLRDDGLRQVAKLILEGWSNQEIAERLDCHVRTIERKRDLIRRAWEREQGS
jgi:FixJ family two-component response regulator